MSSIDLDLTEELEHRDWLRQQRMTPPRAPAFVPKGAENAVDRLNRERAELGPHLMLAMHRRAKRLGLLAPPEPRWGLRVLVAFVVAAVALVVVPGVAHG